jgi:transcriptional regulator with XRE-family HTH domain
VKLEEATAFLEEQGVEKARKFLRSARESAKLSQLELSRLADVPQPNLNRIEDGKQGFTARTFLRLYNAIEKRLSANHREARRSEKLMQLSQKYGPLPQRELMALLRKEEKAKRAEAAEKSRKQFEAIGNLNPLAQYAPLTAIQEMNLARYVGIQADAVNDFFRRALAETQKQEADRRRQLAALEAARQIDDPIIQEIVESFRREIEEKDKVIEDISRELAKANAELDD